jgi:hypothetical protein
VGVVFSLRLGVRVYIQAGLEWRGKVFVPFCSVQRRDCDGAPLVKSAHRSVCQDSNFEVISSLRREVRALSLGVCGVVVRGLGACIVAERPTLL